MTIRGYGLLYSLTLALVPVLLAACVDQGPLRRAPVPTSSPIPPQAEETAIERATETPFAQVVASPAPVRAPTFAARTQPTPTPIQAPEERLELTDVASDAVGVPVDDAFKSVQERSISMGQFAVVLDGSSDLTVLRSLEGGVINGEVAEQQIGPELVTRKSLSAISYEPFTMQIGMNMSRGFADWIEASFDGGSVSMDGSVIAASPNLLSLSEREFQDALISEVTFPKLDAASKDPVFLTVKLEPARIRYQSSASDLPFPNTSSPRKWLASNFRVEIGSLPTGRVSKIDSLTWKQAMTKDQVGSFRYTTLQSTKIEVPNVKLTISTADMKPWLDWHKDFVIDGQSSEADELTGSITLLGPDLEEELATIHLSNIGIIRLSLDQTEANKESMARFTVELYVEDMSFEYRGDAITSTNLNVTYTPISGAVVTATPGPIIVPTADAGADAPPEVEILVLPDMVGPMVSIQYRLFDSTSDLVSVDVAYSLDRGRTFRNASRTIGGEGTSRLSSTPSGVRHTFSWNAGADIAGEQASGVMLRVSPFDSKSKGRPKTTESIEYHALLDHVSRLCKIGSEDWSLSVRAWDRLHTSLSRCQSNLLAQVDLLLQETEPELGATSLRRISVRSDFEVLRDMLDSVDSGTVRLQEISDAAVNMRVSTRDLDDSLRSQESLIEELEARLSSIGDDAQLVNIDLQNSLQKQQQVLQTMSNVSKMLHDTAMAVIRKIG